jgi:hypothetical protein
MDSKQLEQLENELKVIGKLLDCLKYCNFSGHMAQDVAIGQMYMQGLHKHLKDAIAAAHESVNKPVVTDDKPVVEVVK